MSETSPKPWQKQYLEKLAIQIRSSEPILIASLSTSKFACFATLSCLPHHRQHVMFASGEITELEGLLSPAGCSLDIAYAQQYFHP